MRPFQFGDVATRLKRALALQGRDNWGVEESILPVVVAQDSTQPPFADEPREGLGFGDATSIAANQATLAISLTGSGRLWVYQLIVTRATAGRVEVNRSGRLETDGTFTDRNMKDMISNNAPNQGALNLPVTIRQWTVMPAVIGTGIASQFSLAAGVALVWPICAVLSAGEALYVKNLDNLTQITCAFHGRYYPSLP